VETPVSTFAFKTQNLYRYKLAMVQEKEAMSAQLAQTQVGLCTLNQVDP
jgi:hypothetical protein